MTGLPRFGASNANKVIVFADFSRSPHQIPVLEGFLHHSNDMTEPARPLDINTQHNVYVVEELIQFTAGSYEEIIANSHWIEDLT